MKDERINNKLTLNTYYFFKQWWQLKHMAYFFVAPEIVMKYKNDIKSKHRIFKNKENQGRINLAVYIILKQLLGEPIWPFVFVFLTWNKMLRE